MNKTIEKYERLLKEATDKYELPDYKEEKHRDFVVAMHKHGHEVRDYHGRNFYEGPAVVVPRDLVEKVKKQAEVRCVVDSMGHDFIVYPG